MADVKSDPLAWQPAKAPSLAPLEGAGRRGVSPFADREIKNGDVTMKVDGACHCGFITIEGEADPEKVTICHCTDCQTSTGTAFRISVPIPGAAFKMTGQPTTYLKTTADSGNPRLQAFCPRCGTPI